MLDVHGVVPTPAEGLGEAQIIQPMMERQHGDLGVPRLRPRLQAKIAGPNTVVEQNGVGRVLVEPARAIPRAFHELRQKRRFPSGGRESVPLLWLKFPKGEKLTNSYCHSQDRERSQTLELKSCPQVDRICWILPFPAVSRGLVAVTAGDFWYEVSKAFIDAAAFRRRCDGFRFPKPRTTIAKGWNGGRRGLGSGRPSSDENAVATAVRAHSSSRVQVKIVTGDADHLAPEAAAFLTRANCSGFALKISARRFFDPHPSRAAIR
jgi:hypothetical protein